VARLVIQDGATFSGNVSMGPQPDAFAAASEPEAAAATPAASPQVSPPETKGQAAGQARSSDGKSKGKPKR
jgi:hypothetical protein